MTHRGPFQLLPFCDPVILRIMTVLLIYNSLTKSSSCGQQKGMADSDIQLVVGRMNCSEGQIGAIQRENKGLLEGISRFRSILITWCFLLFLPELSLEN